MALVVQKYGGTSVGSIERIEQVAARIVRSCRQGHRVIAVVSAMSGETNRLLGLGRQMNARPNEREMDALVATGEQVSASLLAIALSGMQQPARSLVGHQARILTDGVHAKARISSIDQQHINAVLDEGCVPVVAGFQGIDARGNITTLGRGGTDTTAVAVAAAMQADVCEIYTDVDGVYTTDPNICRHARKIARISYEEMLELASLGAKVLQIRSVELAMKYNVPVHVRSSFCEDEGTMVVQEDASLESVWVSGVALDRNEAKITLRAVPDEPGRVALLFERLAEQAISVDMIIQNISQEGFTDLTFTVTQDDVLRARELTEQVGQEMNATEVSIDDGVAKVSIVGVGMRNHAGVAARMFRLLADEGINVDAISTSEIKVSCLIRTKYAELAVRTLHNGFGLDKASVPPAAHA